MNDRKYARLLGDYERDRLKRSAREARRGYHPVHIWRLPEFVSDYAWLALFALGLGAAGYLFRIGIIGG
jgi:hypothetical protein